MKLFHNLLSAVKSSHCHRGNELQSNFKLASLAILYMCDLLEHILNILLLDVMWISWKRQRFSTFACVWIQILQNIWHRTGFRCTAGWQNQIEQGWHSIINFYFPKLLRCILRNVFFISNMTKAIELFEELLSSKLNLKITVLIKREVLKENTWSGMLQACLQLLGKPWKKSALYKCSQ